jgi:excisionase family DNA binding protein
LFFGEAHLLIGRHHAYEAAILTAAAWRFDPEHAVKQRRAPGALWPPSTKLHRSVTPRSPSFSMSVVTKAEHMSGLLTVAEVAEWLRCSEPTVRRRIRTGEIPAVKLGQGRSAIRISRQALDAWLWSEGEAHAQG